MKGRMADVAGEKRIDIPKSMTGIDGLLQKDR